MQASVLWSDQVPEREGIKSSINDVAVSPDGTRVIVAVGNRVLLYNSENGDLIESLRGHKDTVLSVDYSSDGSRFASGGMDNVVVIWKNTGQGLLKYTHTTPIHEIKYGPSSIQLVSCSETDFGIWTPEQKQVVKEKVPSRIVSAAWNSSGSCIAFGLISGIVTIWNLNSEELCHIERKAPVFCLSFIPNLNAPTRSNTAAVATNPDGTAPVSLDSELLVVGCWDKTLCFYKFQGVAARVQSEKALDYYPCDLSVIGSANQKASYMVIGGSNRKACLYSRDGVRLSDIITRNGWIWGCQSNPMGDRVLIGTDNGTIDMLQMNFTAVHSLHRDRYTYRDSLTEIIVHGLLIDRKVRIKCKDLVQKLAIYKNKLAVQFSDRVCFYESNPDDFNDFHFRLRKERMTLRTVESTSSSTSNSTSTSSNTSVSYMACDHMALGSIHVLFCKRNVMEAYSLDGLRTRVWMVDSDIKFVKVVGGPCGKEGVILGLNNGKVVQVFLDNPFPIPLTQRDSAIISADFSLNRDRFATVDSKNSMNVIDVQTQDVIFNAEGVESVCFNSEVNDMMCYSTAQSIFVISAMNGPSGSSSINNNNGKPSSFFEPQEQFISGYVLAFQGQRVFSLYRGALSSMDIPQGQNMIKALDREDFATAYSIACMGATEADWRVLALRSLRANQLRVAKMAFSRLKDIKYLNLIDQIERSQNLQMYPTTTTSTTTTSTTTSGVSTNSGGVGALTNVPSNSNGSRVRQRGGVGGSNSNPAGNTLAMGGGLMKSSIDPMWLAEIMAYEGFHQEAARMYARLGMPQEAVRLFVDLRRWEDAKMFARQNQPATGVTNTPFDINSLSLQQARWLQETGSFKAAADLYISLGHPLTAAKLLAEASATSSASGLADAPDYSEAMIELVRSTPLEDKETLEFCGDFFVRVGEGKWDDLARETYLRVGDISKLMQLYAQRGRWEEAAKLADEHEGKFDSSVFLPYAEWLISRDSFEDAMMAYKKASRRDLSRQVLMELTHNAVAECRYKDASYYYWLLSKEMEEDNQLIKQAEYELKADLYYAYSSVHSFVTDPFTSHQPDTLFQVSRFIINSLGSADSTPIGISRAATLFTLAKQAMKLSAFKLARHALDRLTKLRLQDKKQEEVELDMLMVQSKPVRDNTEILPVCYRCSSTNPLLNPFTSKFAKGDICTNCGHPFVRSFINFDILPLVEFVPDPNISDEEAIEMIRNPPSHGDGRRRGNSKSSWQEGKDGEANVLRMDNDDYYDERDRDYGIAGDDDLFMRCLNSTLDKQGDVYAPVTVDANTLLQMKRSDVFVCRPSSSSKRATFYRNMLPEIPIAISQPCHRFFHLEDFEFAYLSNKGCPFSRQKNVGEYGSL